MRQILFSSTLFLFLFSQTYAFDLRILGGESIDNRGTNREWLVRFIDPVSKLAFCTGSLMSEDLVITSFKCIGSVDPKELKNTIIGHKGSETTTAITNIYLPYEDEEDSDIKTAFRVYQAKLTPEEEELQAQKEKQDRRSQSDIVVLKLAEPLISSAYVTLPTLETIDDYYETNDTAILLGYGINELGIENIGIPTETNISISGKEFCDSATEEVLQKYAKEEDEEESKINTLPKNEDEEEMASLLICDNALGDKMRYEQSIGICAGDIGAPLIVQEINESNALNMVQIGLASGFLKDGDSLDCGQNTGYYANLSFHSEWLNLILTGDANASEYIKDENLFRDPNEGFYKHIQSLEQGAWHLLGAGAMPVGLDLSKIPSERFKIYFFRDNTMHTINQLTKRRLIFNLYEGFWLFMEKD